MINDFLKLNARYNRKQMEFDLYYTTNQRNEADGAFVIARQSINNSQLKSILLVSDIEVMDYKKRVPELCFVVRKYCDNVVSHYVMAEKYFKACRVKDFELLSPGFSYIFACKKWWKQNIKRITGKKSNIWSQHDIIILKVRSVKAKF